LKRIDEDGPSALVPASLVPSALAPNAPHPAATTRLSGGALAGLHMT
jgi:hypothetical protein